MPDEAEEPNIKSQGDQPSRTELLLLGMVLALFVVALLAGLRIWSEGSH